MLEGDGSAETTVGNRELLLVVRSPGRRLTKVQLRIYVVVVSVCVLAGRVSEWVGIPAIRTDRLLYRIWEVETRIDRTMIGFLLLVVH